MMTPLIPIDCDRLRSIQLSREQAGIDETERFFLDRSTVLERLKAGDSKQAILNDYEGTNAQTIAYNLLENYPEKQIRNKFLYLNWLLLVLFFFVVAFRLYFSVTARQFQFGFDLTMIRYIVVIIFSLWTLFLLASWNRMGYSVAGFACVFALISDLQYREDIQVTSGNMALFIHMSMSLACTLLVFLAQSLLFSKSTMDSNQNT